MPIYNKQRIMLDWLEKANGEEPSCRLDEKLTKEQYIKKMCACVAEAKKGNEEEAHQYADDLICHALKQFCSFGEELVDLYDEVDKWYS
jgi:hypothetical protein